MKQLTVLITFILSVILEISCISCSKPHRYTLSRIALGTIVTITADSRSEKDAINAIEQAFFTISTIEQLTSPYIPTSDVAIINTQSITFIHPDTCTIIQEALHLSSKTNGLFDITFAALGQLWNLNDKHFTPPSYAQILSIKRCVGYQYITLNPYTRTISKQKPCIKIGLGGIAKGYAIHKAATALRINGIKEGIVEAGGDLEVIGNNYGYRYIIGIKHPRKEGICGTVELNNGEAIATSGDYERFATYNGSIYHHIIDPRTGYPAQSDCVSVSVISNNATICDGYATALFIMGTETAISFIQKHTELNLTCILIDKNLSVYCSKALKRRVLFDKNFTITYFD